MKYIEGPDEGNGTPVVELTRRNLNVLLAKLDDDLSARTIISSCGKIAVRAVEDDQHYADREPGQMFMPSAGVTI